MTETFAIVLAGGGERAIPWHAGVLAAETRDPRRAAAIIGTSAGAFVAARVAAGLDPGRPALRANGAPPGYAQLAAVWTATPGTDTDRRRRIGELALAHRGDPDAFVARVRRGLPEGPWPAALRIVAVDAVSGERVVLTADSGVPLADAVAASRAIPTIDPPVPVDGRLCIDGAVGSASNADVALTAAAQTVVISAAFTETLWADALEREVQALEADGRQVVRRMPPP